MPLFNRRNAPGDARLKLVIWKPFQPLPNFAYAREAARGGASVAGLIAFSYVLLTVLSLAGVNLMPDLFEATDPGAFTLANGISLVLAALAAGLAIVIQRRQPLWAILLVAAWGTVEIAFKVLLVAQMAESSGNGGAVAGPAVMMVLIIMLLILAVRGALAMRRMRDTP